MTIWPARPPTEREHLVVAAMQSADDAIVTIAFDGTITNWNAGAEQLFGYSTWEAIGTSISIIVPDDRKEDRTRLFRWRKAAAGLLEPVSRHAPLCSIATWI
jgi:PAS domain S-box-containing protein